MWLSVPSHPLYFSTVPASRAEQAADSCTLEQREWLGNLFTDTWILYFSPICCRVSAICGVYVTFTPHHSGNCFWQMICLGCYYYCQSKVLEGCSVSVSLPLQLILCYCVEWNGKKKTQFKHGPVLQNTSSITNTLSLWFISGPWAISPHTGSLFIIFNYTGRASVSANTCWALLLQSPSRQ